LAWNIENELIRTQTLSPLFALLPKELRDLVFEYALTDSKMHSIESILQRNASKFGIKSTKSSTSDIAVPLLRTCRAVYLETWTSPLALNPHIVYNVQSVGISGVKLHELLPWQLALIQSLDITLQQAALEGTTKLHHYLHGDMCWHPQRRHEGAYVVPRRYKTSLGPRAMTEFPHSFNMSLIPALNSPEPRHFASHILGSHALHPEDPAQHPPWHSAARVGRAKPLTHLTLRILHADWWTWTDDPMSTDPMQHLGLDPSLGDGRAHPSIRPTASRMRALAALRRSGTHPDIVPGVGWAGTVAAMPDLRSLELVLETFRVKKKQLEDVVEAAKTWVFGLEGGKRELVWDGEVAVGGWSGDRGAERSQRWYVTSREFEVRRVRFARRRVG
jgi:hypothetical protein